MGFITFSVCLLFFCHQPIIGSAERDIVVNSTVNIEWASLTFIIPVIGPLTQTRKICRNFSNYYCLEAYEAIINNPVLSLLPYVNVEFPTHNALNYFNFWLERFASGKCRALFLSMFRQTDQSNTKIPSTLVAPFAIFFRHPFLADSETLFFLITLFAPIYNKLEGAKKAVFFWF